MKIVLFIFLIISSYQYSNAQARLDSLITNNKVVIIKDYRLDILAAKQSEINKRF